MKTQETNIAEILKDYPAGTRLYSPVFGDLFLEEVGTERIYTYKNSNNKEWIMFYPDGRYDLKGECALFPSKDQCDWSKFRKPVVPPFEVCRVKEGQPYYFVDENGDAVMVIDYNTATTDQPRWNIGNYFNTEEQAEYAAKKVKELLLSLRKEAGNE